MNKILSTLDGAREILVLDTTCPAKLKFLSLSALVAIMQSVFLAMLAGETVHIFIVSLGTQNIFLEHKIPIHL